MMGFQYFLGPALFRIFRNFERSEKYVGNSLERYGGNIIFCLTLAYNIGIYFVPPWLGYQILTRRSEFLNSATLTQGIRYATGVGVVYLFALSLRAIGRASNPVYREFLQVLNRAVKEPTLANKAKLQEFDSEIFAWPIDFTVKDGRPAGRSGRVYLEAVNRGSTFEYLLSIPNQFLAWMMTHTFGLKLVYPGSIKMLQASLGEALEDGRAKWILEKGGQRFKLQTADNNVIDSMFFDRRESSNANGKTVVITCEGNAGFYEIGFLGSPLDAGYSVIGWNHPGFGGSSGQPFPDQETNAVDTVVQFAIQKLNFKPEEIILHGWSIGGFPASWAAMNYPDVKAVVLDATFDNLLPLATARMPASLETLVTVAIENFMNLNVIDHLKRFNGPVILIRRSYDEIITTQSSDRRSNRGNNLLIGLLEHRFPNIFGPLEVRILHDYLAHDEAGQIATLIRAGVIESEMVDQIHSQMEEGSNKLCFPSSVGLGLEPETKAKLALFLASKYMKDYDSTHCAPLPANLFTTPWELPQPNHNDFVKI